MYVYIQEAITIVKIVSISSTFRSFLIPLCNPCLLPLHTLLHPQGTTAFCHSRLVLHFLKLVIYWSSWRTYFWFFGFLNFFKFSNFLFLTVIFIIFFFLFTMDVMCSLESSLLLISNLTHCVQITVCMTWILLSLLELFYSPEYGLSG